MVSKGQFMGLDWNRITRLHSQVMTGTHELTVNLTYFYNCLSAATYKLASCEDTDYQ